MYLQLEIVWALLVIGLAALFTILLRKNRGLQNRSSSRRAAVAPPQEVVVSSFAELVETMHRSVCAHLAGQGIDWSNVPAARESVSQTIGQVLHRINLPLNRMERELLLDAVLARMPA